jgi:CRISPR-associated endonuclease/helicase Cas3
MLTDLCPIDVLLQRIGRLHRHVRPRPASHQHPEVLVVVPGHRDLSRLLSDRGRARHHHGLGTVYPDLRVIELTWRMLDEHSAWHLPAMNRLLVERCLHSEALDALVASLGGPWRAHGQLIVGAIFGNSRIADLNLIDWTRPYSETTFPDERRIPTRLGESDRRVHFDPPFPSPFGNQVAELTMPGRWALGAPDDQTHATAVECKDSATAFRFGERNYVYDRWGLRPDTDERDDDDGP